MTNNIVRLSSVRTTVPIILYNVCVVVNGFCHAAVWHRFFM